ncbi:MAG: cation diffusion facilitator family transporter [Arenicellales bacterium]
MIENGHQNNIKVITQSQNLERRTLVFSAIGSLIMALLGFGFALLTHSEALMLDGLFSLLGFVMALGAIRISKLVYEPGNSSFQFGYAGFEPLFNVVKGLIIVFISLLALYSSAMVILAGGREINIGWALIYAVIVASSSFAVFAILSSVAKKTGSSLLKVDAKNWLIDSLITVAVLLGFLLTYLARDTPWAWMIPYADPAVVVVLVVLSLPIPYLIIRDGLKELLLGAPDVDLQQKLRLKLEPVLTENGHQNNGMRIAKTGRMIYLYIIVLLQKEQTDPTVSEQDAIRKSLTRSVSDFHPDVEVDLFYTRDTEWAEQF